MAIESVARPLLSVVITLFRRRGFFESAVQSVTSQDISPSEVEVIIVVHPPDVEWVHRTIAAVGVGNRVVTVVQSRSETMGGFEAEGLSRCNGSVICILNDDDQWEPTRLSTVARVFSEDPRVTFFHNGHSVIGPDGNPVSRIQGRRGRAVPPGRVVSVDDRTRESLNLLGSLRADFNTSCMAFRSTLLRPSLPLLSQITALDDTFLFYLALLSEGRICATGAQLTRYRIHSANRSHRTGIDREGALRLAHDLTSRQSATVRVLAQQIALAQSSHLEPYVRREEVFLFILNSIQSTETSVRARSNVLRACAELVAYLRILDPRSNVKVLLTGVVWALQPRVGRLIYSAYRG